MSDPAEFSRWYCGSIKTYVLRRRAWQHAKPEVNGYYDWLVVKAARVLGDEATPQAKHYWAMDIILMDPTILSPRNGEVGIADD